MKLNNKVILCTVFSLFSMMHFCSEKKETFTLKETIMNLFPDKETVINLLPDCVKYYIFCQMKSLHSKYFYRYLNSIMINYKKNHELEYKIGMQYISGRYIFQDINRLYDGKTLLHQAVASKNNDVIKTLLFLGADSLKTDSQGVTPYDIAAPDKESMIKVLLEEYQELQKSRVDLPSQTVAQKYYIKMIHALMTYKEMDKQAYPFIVNLLADNRSKNSLMMDVYLYIIDKKQVDDFINVVDARVTLLEQCIVDNNLDLAQVLLYLGADPMLKNKSSLSAFDLAIQNKNILFVKLFWPYVGCDALRSEMYPILSDYQDELIACADLDAQRFGSKHFTNAVYDYFGISNQDQEDRIPGMIVDFWN